MVDSIFGTPCIRYDFKTFFCTFLFVSNVPKSLFLSKLIFPVIPRPLKVEKAWSGQYAFFAKMEVYNFESLFCLLEEIFFYYALWYICYFVFYLIFRKKNTRNIGRNGSSFNVHCLKCILFLFWTQSHPIPRTTNPKT